MSKAYYTDQLAAQRMQKHFGMEFEATDSRSFKAYVSETSMQVFRPQVGDIVVNCDDDPARVIKDGSTPGPYQVPLASAVEFVGTAAEISRRDGVAFIWPEWEE